MTVTSINGLGLHRARRGSRPPWAPVLWVLAVSGVLGLGILVAGAAGTPSGPVAVGWCFVAVPAIGIVHLLARRTYFCLEMAVHLFALMTFGIRPLYLMAHADQLGSFRWAQRRIDLLTDVTTSDISAFVTHRWAGSVEELIGAGLSLGIWFYCAFLVGVGITYAMGRGGTASPARQALRSRGRVEPAQIMPAVAVLITLGLIGQGAVLAGVGGVSGAVGALGSQDTIQQSFSAYILAFCGVGGLVLWVAYGAFDRVRAIAFALALSEFAAFALVTGSRSTLVRPLLVIIVVTHFARRRWRLREVIAGTLVLLSVASFMLTTRTVARTESFDSGISAGIAATTRLDVVANDNTGFDDIAMLMALVPGTFEHEGGARLVNGLTGVLPGGLIGEKAAQNDVWWREKVWGSTRLAGRPYSLPGEWYVDFGVPGVLLGGLGLGWLAARTRGMGGLTGRTSGGMAVGLALLFVLALYALNGVYSIVLAQAVLLGAPILLGLALTTVIGHAQSGALTSGTRRRRRARPGARVALFHRPAFFRRAPEALTLASRLGAKFASLGFIVVLARVLTPGEFASYAYLFALILTTYVITETGVSLIAGREVARGTVSVAQAYRSGVPSVVGAGALGAIGLVAFATVAPGPGVALSAALFGGLSLLPASLFALQSNLLRCSSRLGSEALLQVANVLLLVALGLSGLALGLGVTGLMIGLTCANVIAATAAHVLLPSPFGVRGPAGLGMRLLRMGIVVGVASTALGLMTRLGMIVVGNFESVESVAEFAVAQRFLEGGMMVWQTLGFALLGRMGHAFRVGERDGWRLVNRLAVMAVVGGAVLGAVVVVSAPFLVPALFGRGYEGAVPLAQAFGLAFPAMAGFFTLWYGLTAGRRDRTVLLGAIGASLLCAGAMAPVLVGDGAIWAAGATGLGFVVGFGAFAAIALRTMRRADG